jgi:hypothetical protein
MAGDLVTTVSVGVGDKYGRSREGWTGDCCPLPSRNYGWQEVNEIQGMDENLQKA